MFLPEMELKKVLKSYWGKYGQNIRNPKVNQTPQDVV